MSSGVAPVDELHELVRELIDGPRLAEGDPRLAALRPGAGLALVAELKTLVDATKLRNARRALELADLAVGVAGQLGEPAAEGLALWARGNALYHLSRYGEALACYRRAEGFYGDGAHQLEVARLQINQVAVLQDLGAFAEALATAEAARAACAGLGAAARPFLALLEMNSGAALQQLARPAEALAAYERGRAILVELGNTVETARIDINRANVLQEQGRFGAAEALYRAARDALAAAGATQEVARAEHNLGKLAFRRGRYQEALSSLEAARQGYAAIPNPLEMAKADLYRAMVYRDLGLYDEAVALAAAAGRSFAAARTRWEAAMALMVEGVCLGQLGAPDEAARRLVAARRLLRRQGAYGRIPPLDLERAGLALAAGHHATARRLAARVARQVRPADWPALAARAYLVQGEAQLAAGGLAQTAVLARAARELARAHELPELARAHQLLARAHEAAGEGGAAWAEQLAAVAAAEGLRARLPLDDLRLAFLDANQRIYRDGARLALAGPDDAVALAAVDLALSAPLPRPGVPRGEPAARAAVAALREEWAYLQSAADEPGAGAGPGEAGRRAVEAALADQTRRLGLGRGADVAAATADDLLAADQAAAALAALQARLAPDEALLVYAPSGDGVWAFVVTRGALVRRRLALRPAAIERLLRSWRFQVGHAYGVAAGSAAWAAARAHLGQLDSALLAPLAAELAGARHLTIAAPPEWHELPFAAALGPGGHLVERHSLSLVAAPRSVGRSAEVAPRAAPALVVACSDGGRLPAVAPEAEAVAAALGQGRPVRRLIEAEATRDALLGAMPDCGLIHLAAHAYSRPDNPLFSWARLADGHLLVADLGALSLPQRPLVVLSACETGRGRPVGGGLAGMARAFLLAGASALVASLWQVADGSTAALMADFYRALAGGEAAAALAAAQRRAIARGEHPFHWAPFVVLAG